MRNRTSAALTRWLGGVVDLLLGYDFFISYAHDDGTSYPRALSERLEEAGFGCSSTLASRWRETTCGSLAGTYTRIRPSSHPVCRQR